MRFFQLLAGVVALTVFSLTAMAQDAQQIINMTARLYADAPSFTGEIDSRLIQLIYTPIGEGKFSAPEVNGTQYRRLQLKVRRPYGYWLSVQVYLDGAVANTTVSSSVVARADDKLPKQGIGSGSAFVVRDMPPEQFNAAANSRLGAGAVDDVVLRYFQATGAISDGEHPLGIVEPDLIGSESLGGAKVYRIVAKTTQNEPITLWIDKESLMVVRSIVQRANPTAVASAEPAKDEIRKILVCETLYKKQQLAPVLGAGDFAVTSGLGNERTASEALGFIPVPELLKLAEVSPVK